MLLLSLLLLALQIRQKYKLSCFKTGTTLCWGPSRAQVSNKRAVCVGSLRDVGSRFVFI